MFADTLVINAHSLRWPLPLALLAARGIGESDTAWVSPTATIAAILLTSWMAYLALQLTLELLVFRRRVSLSQVCLWMTGVAICCGLWGIAWRH